MGGKPNPGTPADQRLKANNPNAGKGKATPVKPAMPAKPAPKPKGK